jgi:hypothetical protein
VLHDMFAVPFDEIAPIIDRSSDATRQLASRARRRVQGERAIPDGRALAVQGFTIAVGGSSRWTSSPTPSDSLDLIWPRSASDGLARARSWPQATRRRRVPARSARISPLTDGRP